jgi:hypothetical protein
MILKKVGFFQGLPYGDPAEDSLKDLVGKFSGPHLAEAIKYLKSGHLLVVAPGISRDYLSGDQKIIGSMAILTDGVYAWPKDIAYYIEKYQIGMSNEFLEHMKGQKWVVPSVDISSLEF